MACEWHAITLANVMSFSNGRASPDRGDGLPYPVHGSNGVIGFADEANADHDTIVIGRVGSYCGSLYFSKQKCWVTDNAIRANALDDNDAKFLFYLLQTLDLNHWRAGSGQPLLNQAILGAIPASVPDPIEQRAIAHILGTLDDKIELNRKMNEMLEAMAQAIFKSWFVDFDPVRAKAEGRDPRLPKEIADLFPDSFQDSELGEIPKGWRAGKVNDLAMLSRETVNPNDYPEEVFDHYSIPAFDEGRLPKAEIGEQIQSNKFVVSPDAVLLSKLNPRFPRVWLPDTSRARRSVCSMEFLVSIPRSDISREYLYSLFNSQLFLQIFTTLVTGTSSSHQRVKPDYLLGMDVIIPTQETVDHFTELVRTLLDRVAQNITESRTLAALRDTLLPKLISGELRVKDAETFTTPESDIVKQGTGAVYTIGHSNHSIQDFIGLLKQHGVTAVADVRSSPFSRHHPQFNRDTLADALRKDGMAYVFLGKELGARSDDPRCYDNGQANFERMAESPTFKQGIDRLLKGRDQHCIALLCAEKEPLDCHRTILVSRNLRKLGVPVNHIMADGSIEEHQDTERRLVGALGLQNSLFEPVSSDSERLEKAYNQQARKIAYKRDDTEDNHEHAE